MINIAEFFNDVYPEENKVQTSLKFTEVDLIEPPKTRKPLQSLPIFSRSNVQEEDNSKEFNIWAIREKDKENSTKKDNLWSNLDDSWNQSQSLDSSRCLFVGNIINKEVDEIMKLIFKFFGKDNVEYCQIHQALHNQKKKFAIVQFFEENKVQELLEIDTKTCFKETPMKKWIFDKVRNFQQNPETSLFIYVTKDLSDIEIINIFKDSLKIQILSFERSLSKKGRKLNYGFVYLYHKSDLEFILKNQVLINPIIVSKVKEREPSEKMPERNDKPIYTYSYSSDDVNELQVLKKLDILLEKEHLSMIQEMTEYTPFFDE